MDYQHIDLAFLEKFTNGDKSRMRRYIGMFVDTAPASLESLDRYYREQNWEQLRSSAHSLKPQIGYMGINRIKEDILAIEEKSRHLTDLDTLPGLIARVDRECRDALHELRHAMAELDP